MILQFKVSLTGMKPPVWRRLQVDGDMTFYELHEVIQAAFDWYDYHLHAFNMRKSRGQRLENIEIGSEDDELWGPNLLYDLYDERKEKLSDWFIVEKDRAIYTYDFGDNWEHEIVLEKVLPPEEGVLYPRCVKAVRHAPEEDSRGELIEGLWEPEEVDPNELKEEINEKLFSLAKPAEPNSFQGEAADLRLLFEKAKEFNELKPWKQFNDDEIFIVEDPMTGEKMFCSILGALEEEFGMAVYIGYEGFQTLLKIMKGDLDPFDILVEQRCILLSFVNRDELEEEDYQLIKNNGMSFRGKKQWPQFRSYKPGLVPWTINAEEARLLKIAIEQAMVIVREVENHRRISFMHEGSEMTVRVPKTVDGDIHWSTEILSIYDLDLNEPPQEKQQLLVSKMDMKRLLKYKKLNVPIEIDFFRADMPVQERPGDRPYFPMMAVAVEKRNGLVIFHELSEGKMGQDYYQQTFVKMMNQLEKTPREIWVKSRSRQMLDPLLNELRITAIEVEHLPQMEELKELMAEMLFD